MADPTRVLVIDDSALVRKLLSEILASDPDIEVVGTAPDAKVALKKIQSLQPHVLTLDVEMPGMDGLTFLERLMKSQPLPVVMVSAYTQAGAPTALRALELGAVEVIGKPQSGLRVGMEEISVQIIDTVKAARHARIKDSRQLFLRPKAKQSTDAELPKLMKPLRTGFRETVIAVGASTGGTEALLELLQPLPETMPGIVVVQHMPAVFTKSFAERLNQQCRLEVKEAEAGDVVQSGRVLIAPGDQHLLLESAERGYRVRLQDSPLVNRHRPAVDVLFRSVAQVAGRQAIGVILTGMGNDGADGMREMRDSGAHNLAQDEASCVVFGMPKVAIERGGVDQMLSLEAISVLLMQLTHEQG
ncbi:MAG: chemotaxis response regulator protein-glutamate methylesterase [Deltaproteobacteria bacterium]|jgi:two-component system chemotaxis response regulator CheB|nr:chemotaxis response regulator protein-glutamate methylesterase [Deltaproteobacteria bacterium]MDP7629019.1 chemotaxis response regulator protein-glutamate methylesterase [SAR324 cluster bacterium]